MFPLLRFSFTMCGGASTFITCHCAGIFIFSAFALTSRLEKRQPERVETIDILVSNSDPDTPSCVSSGKVLPLLILSGSESWVLTFQKLFICKMEVLLSAWVVAKMKYDLNTAFRGCQDIPINVSASLLPRKLSLVPNIFD